MTKTRTYITPSSIGSYFGVGFNTPEEQLEIDLGNVEETFDDDSKDRMLLGKMMEDASLNYFEQKFGIKITDRNNEMMDFYDGKIKGIVDGMTVFNGEPTVVENKISNAKSGRFTEKMAYVLQCQAYMLAKNVNQCLLLGMYQGEPIFKLIKRDEDMIRDIKIMADFICDVLMGLDDFSNFPTFITSKYSSVVPLPEVKNASDEVIAKAKELAVLKEQAKDIENRVKEIENFIKDNFQPGVFSNDSLKITVSEVTKDGGFDLDRCSIDNPSIEFSKYKKPPYSYKTIRVMMKH